jgi:hypothetical protein
MPPTLEDETRRAKQGPAKYPSNALSEATFLSCYPADPVLLKPSQDLGELGPFILAAACQPQATRSQIPGFNHRVDSESLYGICARALLILPLRKASP